MHDFKDDVCVSLLHVWRGADMFENIQDLNKQQLEINHAYEKRKECF